MRDEVLLLMLGRRSGQRKLFGARSLLSDRDLNRMGFFGRIARVGEEIFDDEDFSAAYCLDNGRPSAPPSLVALATLLQFREGLSDRATIDCLRYDLRWKAALHLDAVSTEAPFSRTTLQAFRVRLTLHELEGRAFERSVEVAQEAGLLPRRLRLAVDSTPVRGRGAVKDTYNLLSDAIAQVLRRVADGRDEDVADLARSSGLGRHVLAPSVKGSEDVEWSDPEAVRAFLKQLVQDCRDVLELAESEGVSQGQEAELLRRILVQDIEGGHDDDEPPRVRRRVAKERVVSVSDPEIRTRHKSKSSKYSGHKAHAATDIDSGIVTAVAVTSPNASEGEILSDLVEQTRDLCEAEIDEVLGDCSYGTRPAVQAADQAGVRLRSRMPRGSQQRFPARDFQVSDDLRSARCPAGHSSQKAYRAGVRGWIHKWSKDHCQACPLKAQCTTADRRSLSVSEDFHDRRRREQEAWSPEGRLALRSRVAVEHAIARLKARGAGNARYFSAAKTQFQWLWTAAAANLYRTWAWAA